jgi:hypothetical protein
MPMDTAAEVLNWGQLSKMSNPFLTDAKQLTVVELNLIPGNGHDLYKQPDQEKVICCV